MDRLEYRGRKKWCSLPDAGKDGDMVTDPQWPKSHATLVSEIMLSMTKSFTQSLSTPSESFLFCPYSPQESRRKHNR